MIVLIAIVPSVYLQSNLSREQIAHWNTQVELAPQRRMIEATSSARSTSPRCGSTESYGYLMGLRFQLRDADEKRRLDFQKR